MLKNLLLNVIILVLLGTTGYYYWQTTKLQDANQTLAVDNMKLKTELASVDGRHAGRHHRNRLVLVDQDAQQPENTDPAEGAEQHLDRAKEAIAAGNIGDAVAQTKLAAADIQLASSSTSADAQHTVGELKQKLAVLQQETSTLWSKLGV